MLMMTQLSSASDCLNLSCSCCSNITLWIFSADAAKQEYQVYPLFCRSSISVTTFNFRDDDDDAPDDDDDDDALLAAMLVRLSWLPEC